MSPHDRWLPALLAVLLVACQCHRGRKPETGPQASNPLTVILYGLPDSGALCSAAEALEDTLAKESFVKSLNVSGQEVKEIVIGADPDKLNMIGVEFSTLAQAVRQGLPDVPKDAVSADEKKQSVSIAMPECKPLDLDADQIMTITVKNPQGNFVPLGALAVLKVQLSSQGLYHDGARALRVEVSLADGADREEAKTNLETAMDGRFKTSLLKWEIF